MKCDNYDEDCDAMVVVMSMVVVGTMVNDRRCIMIVVTFWQRHYRCNASFYDLLLELGGPAVAFEWVSPQVEGDSVKSAPGPEAIVPELNQPDLVEGEVDVEVGALQEVQVAWTDLWILGSQKVVAHVEHLQGEKVYVEGEGYLGQLVVGQVQLDHALKDVRVVGPSVDVVVGQIDLGQPLVAAKKLSWEVEQVVLVEVECFQLLQS